MSVLSGKRTLITGAASGIGLATARLFADSGADLVLSDINHDALNVAADELGAVACAGDISSEADVKTMVETCRELFGGLDVVVANAGVFLDATAVAVTAGGWDSVMATDARGTFLTCKHAIRVMLVEGSGAIVCVSSISGIAGQPEQAAYGPAKFAVSGLTMHLAVEFAARGIRINAVAPGTIATEGLAFLSPAKRADLLARHPMGRFGRPEEVARAIRFLASDDAAFVTGAILPVDGGFLAQ